MVLADAPDEEQGLSALMAGASGYVDRDIDPDRLPAVLLAVARGEPAVPRALVAPLLRELRLRRGPDRARLDRARDARLTDREWEVLAMLESGLRTADIARRLALSPVTVRRHVARLVAALGVADRAEAVALLRAAGRGPVADPEGALRRGPRRPAEPASAALTASPS